MKTSFFVLVLTGAFAILWMLKTEQRKQTVPAVVEQAMDTLAGAESGAVPDESTEVIQSATQAVREPTQPRDPEVTAWLKRSGFTTEYNMHFSDREFLEGQAASGDMLAAQTLGYQTLGTPRSTELLTDVAKWGSLQALHYLSSSSELVADGKLKEQRGSQVSQTDQHEYSIKALAGC